MGLFDRRRSRFGSSVGTVEAGAFLLEGEERVAAVGESFYQPALLAICGARRGEEAGEECIAELVPEPANPHDPNAVMVLATGRQVAHLSRSDALAYRPELAAAEAAGRVIVCPAFIAGRGSDSETANLGIFLKLPSPREALSSIQDNRA